MIVYILVAISTFSTRCPSTPAPTTCEWVPFGTNYLPTVSPTGYMSIGWVSFADGECKQLSDESGYKVTCSGMDATWNDYISSDCSDSSFATFIAADACQSRPLSDTDCVVDGSHICDETTVAACGCESGSIFSTQCSSVLVSTTSIPTNTPTAKPTLEPIMSLTNHTTAYNPILTQLPSVGPSATLHDGEVKEVLLTEVKMYASSAEREPVETKVSMILKAIMLLASGVCICYAVLILVVFCCKRNCNTKHIQNMRKSVDPKTNADKCEDKSGANVVSMNHKIEQKGEEMLRNLNAERESVAVVTVIDSDVNHEAEILETAYTDFGGISGDHEGHNDEDVDEPSVLKVGNKTVFI